MKEITGIFENGIASGLNDFSSQINWLFVVCILVVSLVLVIPTDGKQLIKGNPRLIIIGVGFVMMVVFWIFGEQEHTIITFITDIFAIFTAALIYIIGKIIINLKNLKK